MRTPDQIVAEIEKAQEEKDKAEAKLAGLRIELEDMSKYILDHLGTGKQPETSKIPRNQPRLKTVRFLPGKSPNPARQPGATFVDSAFGEA